MKSKITGKETESHCSHEVGTKEHEMHIISKFDAYFEKGKREEIILSNVLIIGMAIVAGKPKKSRKVLPKPNIEITVIISDPLNLFVANIGFTYRGRGKYFLKMDDIWAALALVTVYVALPVSKVAWDAEKTLYDAAKRAKNTLAADQHYANLVYMTKQNAIYVANTCGNDLVVFNTSGYTANKTTKSPVQTMGKAVIRGAKDTKVSGEVKIEIEEMPGATGYECYYQAVSVPPSPVIFNCSGPQTRPTLKKLPLVPLLITTRAIGPKGPGDMSDPKPYTPR